MCRLIPLNLENGRTIEVSEYKAEKLKQYLRIFPLLPSIDKVILFGSALETRCREDSDIDFLLCYNDREKFREDMSLRLPELFPDSVYDDMLRLPTGTKAKSGVQKEAEDKGIIFYERSICRPRCAKKEPAEHAQKRPLPDSRAKR